MNDTIIYLIRHAETVDEKGIRNTNEDSQMINEKEILSIQGEEQSKKLGYIKAKAVFDNMQGDRAIIGSDTMVVKNEKVYEKPKSREEAIQMLNELQGTRHTVYTSLAILVEEKGEYKEYIDLIKTDVYFKRISQKEIEEYVDNDEVMDKAGSYAIQSSFCKFIKKHFDNLSKCLQFIFPLYF